MPQYLNAITITTHQAIADTGATSIFIMEGADVDNKRIAENPLTINLPDGKKVLSSHVCDYHGPANNADGTYRPIIKSHINNWDPSPVQGRMQSVI